jgi:hypothetical protein
MIPATTLCDHPCNLIDVMLSPSTKLRINSAKHLAFSSCFKSGFFGGVYPEHTEGPQNDITRTDKV